MAHPLTVKDLLDLQEAMAARSANLTQAGPHHWIDPLQLTGSPKHPAQAGVANQLYPWTNVGNTPFSREERAILISEGNREESVRRLTGLLGLFVEHLHRADFEKRFGMLRGGIIGAPTTYTAVSNIAGANQLGQLSRAGQARLTSLQEAVQAGVLKGPVSLQLDEHTEYMLTASGQVRLSTTKPSEPGLLKRTIQKFIK